MREICVFCGASTPSKPEIGLAMDAFADGMLERGWGLVYGGGRVGLMGRIANRVMAGGGRVLGVIPRQLERRELAHHELTELVETDDMHSRKALMYERSDAFVAFPGGFGTLDEVMEILTWKQLEIHGKPVVFANIDGYFDGLKDFCARAEFDGLLQPHVRAMAHFADDVPAVLAYLDAAPRGVERKMNWA